MSISRTVICLGFLHFGSQLLAQEQVEIRPDRVEPMEFLGTTQAYRDWDSTRVFPNERTKQERLGFHAKNDWYLHKEWRADALPQGVDPALQADGGT